MSSGGSERSELPPVGGLSTETQSEGRCKVSAVPAYHARIALNAHEGSTGAICAVVLHAEVDTLASPPNWASIAQDVNTWLTTQWTACLSDKYFFDNITVTDENYQGSTFGQGVRVIGVNGSRVTADQGLSKALCAVGSFKTALAKRYARGHMFFPPAQTTAAAAAGGVWNSSNAYQTANQAFLTRFAAGFTAGSTGYVPEIFSRTHTPKISNSPPAWGPPVVNPIIAASLGNAQHFLRSRLTVP